ncbi:type VI secretion system Vgr family protein [Tahibacter harae]|uniref:Type VI secretion system tip protein VgrG n=1 Tax=Tahibacter harae TaxID=2963937 RepID=A0ABT1QYX7_9GAMM|nr:type VI secretion system tip protein VgrG [Tahibacter harae]MCQ4167486.1 type VI secretion system tip protein VgrG [Tahibacter harae]
MNRTLNVTTPLGPEVLRFDSLQGRESLSQLFDFQLTLTSEEKGLAAPALLGQPITVDFELEGGARRYLNGQCVHFRSAGRAGRRHLYVAQLKPWLWYATRRSDYRIFQQMTTPDIVKQVLAMYPFQTKWLLSRSYRKWNYCVQYRETDANFVQRLLEHEGIWYWFEHSAGEHTLVMTDDIGLATPYPGYATIPFYPQDVSVPDKDHFNGWAAGGNVQSGKYAARDYNFVMPSADLTTQRAQPAGHPHASYDIFDYPGSYPTLGEGDPYARVRLEELQSSHLRSFSQGRARGVAPGRLFTLEKHAVGDYNKEYLVVGAEYDFSDNDYEATEDSGEHRLTIAAEVHPTDQPYRPERRTPKPHTMGPESAVVTGPAGQEIYTNEHGQVKVQFHWDRYGKKDENSSCWIRVSHPWAGTGFGGVHIPRIGQEVLVDHLNGDPDQPIIVGRVYNTNNPHPWGLPANATQSGFLTRSSMGATWQNANALRFEDKKGEEQVWLHAEKNQDIEVENDETHWVGHDRTKTIDHDETVHVKHDRTETVDHNETITVHNDRSERVDHNEKISIGDNRSEDVGKNETVSIGNNQTHSVGDNRTRRVGKNESLTIGSSRTKKVGKNESDKIGKSWSIKVGKFKTETIGMASMQNVGLGKMTTVGMAYMRTVGMMMTSQVGTDRTDTIGNNHTAKVGSVYKLLVGPGSAQDGRGAQAMSIVAPSGGAAKKESSGSSISMDKDTIVLQAGPSKVVITPDGIFLDGPDIHLKAAKTVNADAPDDVHLNSGTALAAPALESQSDASEQ